MKDSNVKKVILLGSGALKIGQAGEFDYSGSQALKALREEGVETILVNPNIATVQTSEGVADKVYFLPVTPYFVEKVIEKERPQGILLSFGGQTALNCGVELWRGGVLGKYGVKVLGTPVESIMDTEDRELFVERMDEIGIHSIKSHPATNLAEAQKAAAELGYPVIIRAAYALGGLGSGFCDDEAQLSALCKKAFSFSPQVLVEKSLKGWKEIEYEVVRDRYDNCVTVCNMENFDPLGIHTGESIVVAPSQTLSNEDYQMLRELAIKIVRHLGIVGECNVQYALDPDSRDYRVIEVNARLSRSSALASKATGYPLAFVAAKLGLGYGLFDLRNSVTQTTPAFFEPALDYVVCKIPRWDLGKFRGVSRKIGSSMKSVGEVMSIGRTFEEAIQKGLRSIGQGAHGFVLNKEHKVDDLETALREPTDSRIFVISKCLEAGWPVDRIHALTKIDKWFLHKLENIVRTSKKLEGYKAIADVPRELFLEAKQRGFSDFQIQVAVCKKAGDQTVNADKVRARRIELGILPCVKQIDTLAAEFPAKTNYLYLTYNGSYHDIDLPAGRPSADGSPATDDGARRTNSDIPETAARECAEHTAEGVAARCVSTLGHVRGRGPADGLGGMSEANISAATPSADGAPATDYGAANSRQEANGRAAADGQGRTEPADGGTKPYEGRSVIVIGSGAYRIGSSVEFDWCSVTCLDTLRAHGCKGVMINCNPETVSTDYDICDRLYFEELTYERVMDIVSIEQPYGVVVSVGGQIPNNLAMRLWRGGVHILGTSAEDIDKAEDRDKFSGIVDAIGVAQPRWCEAASIEEVDKFISEVGFPVLVRPSYVLSGAAMNVCHDRTKLIEFLSLASEVSKDHPVVLSQFMQRCKEVEFDAVADRGQVIAYAISEHVEYAGVHSGDATIVFPAQKLYSETIRRIRRDARKIAEALNISGPFNIQFLAQENDIKVIECNLRASRSFPFVSKILKVNLIELATKVMLGEHPGKQDKSMFDVDYVGVKAAQFSFSRLEKADPMLGVDMSSTGEVGCLGNSFDEALLKSLLSVGFSIPCKGVLLSTGGALQKADMLKACRMLADAGIRLYATAGTQKYLSDNDIKSTRVLWPSEESYLNLRDEYEPALRLLRDRRVDMVVNVPKNYSQSELDNGYQIRRAAVDFNIPLFTDTRLAGAFIRAFTSAPQRGPMLAGDAEETRHDAASISESALGSLQIKAREEYR